MAVDYTYTNGQGIAQLDPTKPNSNVELVNILGNAITQVKSYLADPMTLGGCAFKTTCSRIGVGQDFTTSGAGSSAKALLTLGTSEVFDLHSDYSVSTGLFTAPWAGVFQFTIGAEFALVSGSVTLFGLLGFLKNGSDMNAGNTDPSLTLISPAFTTGGTANCFGVTTLQLAKGDTLGVLGGIDAASGACTMAVSGFQFEGRCVYPT